MTQTLKNPKRVGESGVGTTFRVEHSRPTFIDAPPRRLFKGTTLRVGIRAAREVVLKGH